VESGLSGSALPAPFVSIAREQAFAQRGSSYGAETDVLAIVPRTILKHGLTAFGEVSRCDT
jgi:hypothetical protein